MKITLRDDKWIKLFLVKGEYFILEERSRRRICNYDEELPHSGHFTSILLTYRDHDYNSKR